MKIAVITDVHANLPALRAALEAIQNEGYDALFHTGDAIAIGPFPAECLDVLLNTPNIVCLMGNHDLWFAEGLPQPRPAWMSDGEVQHQHWTHACIEPQLRSVVAQWPFMLHRQFDGVEIIFAHYGLDRSGRDFAPVVKQPTASDLDRLFEPHRPTLVFYGHHHPFSDVQGRARYINLGSLGCHHLPVARYTVVEFHSMQYMVNHRQIPYDDTDVFAAFEQRKVPDREFIYHAFFGGRFRG